MICRNECIKALALMVVALPPLGVGLMLVYADPPADLSFIASKAGPWRELRKRRLQAHGIASGPHGERVTHLAFNSNGSELATTGEDNVTRLWEMPQQELLRTLTMSAPAAAFGPDLQQFAVTALPIREVELPSGRLRHKFGHVYCLAYSTDSEILAVGEGAVTGSSGDAKIRLYRVADKMPLMTLKGHERYVKSLAFSPDSKLLASNGWDGTVRLWSVADGKMLHNQQGPRGSLAFSPDGKLLASGGQQAGELTIWKVPELERLHKWDWNPISDLAFSPNGKVLAVCSRSDTIPYPSLHLIRVSDGKQMQTLVDEKTTAVCIAFHPDGNLLVAGMSDGTIRFFGSRDHGGQ